MQYETIWHYLICLIYYLKAIKISYHDFLNQIELKGIF